MDELYSEIPKEFYSDGDKFAGKRIAIKSNILDKTETRTGENLMIKDCYFSIVKLKEVSLGYISKHAIGFELNTVQVVGKC